MSKYTVKDCDALELSEFITTAEERGEELLSMASYQGLFIYNPNLAPEVNHLKNVRFALVFKKKWW